MIHLSSQLPDIEVKTNVEIVMRQGGKLVPGSRREGHNVFTNNGRNLLTKLVSWSSIAGSDIPYTNRRTRWIGIGTGSQLEVSSVASLNQPHLITPTNFLVEVQTVEFPSPTSVAYLREFGTGEITVTGAPVTVTEAGMFADVSPANMGGTEDFGHSAPADTTLDPTVGTNPPITYKAFEGLTKTVDFTLELKWTFRF